MGTLLPTSGCNCLGPDDRSTSLRKAFSLLELVLVVAIVAVLAAIATPRYSASISRYRAQAAARRVVADLALARARAYATSTSVTVRLDVEGDKLVISAAAPMDGTGSNYTTDLREEPYQADIAEVSLGGDMYVIFDIYGKPDSAGKVLILVGENQQLVYLDPDTGEASIL